MPWGCSPTGNDQITQVWSRKPFGITRESWKQANSFPFPSKNPSSPQVAYPIYTVLLHQRHPFLLGEQVDLASGSTPKTHPSLLFLLILICFHYLKKGLGCLSLKKFSNSCLACMVCSLAQRALGATPDLPIPFFLHFSQAAHIHALVRAPVVGQFMRHLQEESVTYWGWKEGQQWAVKRSEKTLGLEETDFFKCSLSSEFPLATLYQRVNFVFSMVFMSLWCNINICPWFLFTQQCIFSKIQLCSHFFLT